MNNFLKPYIEFLETVNWTLIFVSLLMIGLVALVGYVLYTMATSIQYRRNALKVSLPDIEDIGKKAETKKQFKEVDEFELELVSSEDDNTDGNDIVDEDLLVGALTRETRQYIPSSKDKNLRLPKVDEFNEVEDSNNLLDKDGAV